MIEHIKPCLTTGNYRGTILLFFLYWRNYSARHFQEGGRRQQRAAEWSWPVVGKLNPRPSHPNAATLSAWPWPTESVQSIVLPTTEYRLQNEYIFDEYQTNKWPQTAFFVFWAVNNAWGSVILWYSLKQHFLMGWASYKKNDNLIFELTWMERLVNRSKLD